jgi:hypothetical protein
MGKRYLLIPELTSRSVYGLSAHKISYSERNNYKTALITVVMRRRSAPVGLTFSENGRKTWEQMKVVIRTLQAGMTNVSAEIGEHVGVSNVFVLASEALVMDCSLGRLTVR